MMMEHQLRRTLFLLILFLATMTMMSDGSVWPKPQQQRDQGGFLIVRPAAFRFKISPTGCDILDAAAKRHLHLIQGIARRGRAWRKASRINNKLITAQLRDDPAFLGYLDTLEIQLMDACIPDARPQFQMNEEYNLSIISPTDAKIASSTVWGMLRGFETFNQLINFDSQGVALIVNATTIFDFPRFTHRGILLDTARHFIPVSHIIWNLDAMEINKMNVLHWHLSDDQSFPYESAAFPKLSEFGAYSPLHVYTRSDVARVLEHARMRGIRVIAEFDTPGHTTAWGKGYPELLTNCVHEDSRKVLDPVANTTYEFMEQLLTEIKQVFPDEYIHLGGDEVDFSCWEGIKEIEDLMKKEGLATLQQVEGWYLKKVLNIVNKIKGRSIVWQEIFDDGVQLSNDVIVHVWKEGNHFYELNKITNSNLTALLSACWYLDHLDETWVDMYKCEPLDFAGTEQQYSLVLGGEACMWAEMVDETNILPRMWPRASAAAEKLWSARDADSLEGTAIKRINEHVCRMQARGIPAQPPTGPGYCPLI